MHLYILSTETIPFSKSFFIIIIIIIIYFKASLGSFPPLPSFH